MTFETMQSHESVTLHYAGTDFRRQGLIALVSDHVTGKSVLDLRCLRGDLAVKLLKEGRSVSGLDGYQQAVSAANSSARACGFEGEMACFWQLKNLAGHTAGSSFDTVLCIDLLNHVESDRETLSEIHKVLHKDGELLLLVPAFPFLLGQRDRELGHLRRYSKSQIKALLADTGFEAVSLRFWNALALIPYIFIERILGRKVSDKVRFGAADPSSRLLGPLLRFWYRHIERHVPFPAGLSIFIVAKKKQR